jgi:Holliday junction resolvase-like predicted endonuclease
MIMEFTERMVIRLYESADFDVFYFNCPCCDVIARKRGRLVLVEVKGTGHPFISIRQACAFFRVAELIGNAEAVIAVVGDGKVRLYNLVDVIDYYGLDCHDDSALFDDEELDVEQVDPFDVHEYSEFS